MRKVQFKKLRSFCINGLEIKQSRQLPKCQPDVYIWDNMFYIWKDSELWGTSTHKSSDVMIAEPC